MDLVMWGRVRSDPIRGLGDPSWYVRCSPGGMATRMATLLFGAAESPDATLPLPIHAPASRAPVSATAKTEPMPARSRNEVPPPAPPTWGTSAPSLPPPLGKRPPREPHALPGLVVGLAWTAAVWLGLALFMIAFAYPFTWLAQFALAAVGGWLVAAGVAYALSSSSRSSSR